MFLKDLLQLYLRDHETGVSRGTEMHIHNSLCLFARFLGHPPTTADLSDEVFNAFVDWLKEGRAFDTVRTRRGDILLLWNESYRRELVDHAPRRIRKLKRGRRSPEAWTPGEVRTLLRTAEGLHGCYRKIEVGKARYWSSLIRGAWDSALRLGDLLAVPVDAVPHPGEPMRVIQRKTDDEILVRFSGPTIEAIRLCCAYPSPRELVWPLWARREQWFVEFRKLVAAAGIRPGTFRWVRRSSITAVERQQSGAGTQHAGHRTASVTWQNYIDRAQLAADKPLPPPLE